MEAATTRQHAHQNTIYHCLFAYYKLGYSKQHLRKPRISILAFIGVSEILDYYNTEGTFDRVKFTKCCQDFVYSTRGRVRQYPGRHSVWILDGASIHSDPEIVHYLRSVGVTPILLPVYCPFFNPIEFLFGYVKCSFQHHYAESSKRDLFPFAIQTFRRFEGFDRGNVFAHCGWKHQGYFDPVRPLSTETKKRCTQAPNTDEWNQDD
ncbi:Serine/threonine-protein kinase [Phytophthora megakarya]|uniref:Serine/threonine-protein kinase n=1 Tax=Phytophthora megakarya TaxID=4795 RepID=A0A225W1S2_9STRA|nr:Serine/threonine-protein kinase [Phytophthora megakarya]